MWDDFGVDLVDRPILVPVVGAKYLCPADVLHPGDAVLGIARKYQFPLIRVGAVAAHPCTVGPRGKVEFHLVLERLVVHHSWFLTERGRHVAAVGLCGTDQFPRVTDPEGRPVCSLQERDVVQSAHCLKRFGQLMIQRGIEFVDSSTECLDGRFTPEILMEKFIVPVIVDHGSQPIAGYVRATDVTNPIALKICSPRIARQSHQIFDGPRHLTMV